MLMFIRKKSAMLERSNIGKTVSRIKQKDEYEELKRARSHNFMLAIYSATSKADESTSYVSFLNGATNKIKMLSQLEYKSDLD